MKNGANRLALYRVTINPQFVKNIVSARCNKTRYVCNTSEKGLNALGNVSTNQDRIICQSLSLWVYSGQLSRKQKVTLWGMWKIRKTSHSGEEIQDLRSDQHGGENTVLLLPLFSHREAKSVPQSAKTKENPCVSGHKTNKRGSCKPEVWE